MEKENENICLIKEHKFCIMGYGVSNELTKYEKIKKNSEDGTEHGCIYRMPGV